MGVEEQIWDSGLGYMAKGVPVCDITEECRYSFYKAFGILPDMQEALEYQYSLPVSIEPPTPMTFPDVACIDRENNPLAQWLNHAK